MTGRSVLTSAPLDPAQQIQVMKFGGTSVGTTTERLRAVAERIARRRREGYAVVVVVSARGLSTDELVAQAYATSAAPVARELDQLLATGEVVSAALLAIALNDAGVPATSLTGAQAGISASGRHGDGRVAVVDRDRVLEVTSRGQVAVVAGFQGVGDQGDVLTLGRGGSDTTAVALAAALGAATCEIYTDVDGVHSADPRIVTDTRLLVEVGSDVMAELAYAGARVLHPRSVELAGREDVRIHVRSAFADRPGTVVVPRSGGEELENTRPVTAIAHDTDVAHVVIPPGALAGRGSSLFTALSAASITVDLVARVDGGWSFTVAQSRVPALRDVLERLGCRAELQESMAKLSLVGSGLLRHPETIARMLEVLDEAGVEPRSLSTSQVRVTVTVAGAQCVRAVRLLHHEFGLDRSSSAGHPVAV